MMSGFYLPSVRQSQRMRQHWSAAGAGLSPPVTEYNYWRINVTAIGGGTAVQIQEIELHSTVGGADICVGGVAEASSVGNGNRAADKAFDDNLTDVNSGSWQADAGLPQWIAITLPSPMAVAEVKIWPPYLGSVLNRAPVDFQILRGPSAADIVEVASFSGVSGWAVGVPKTFAIT